jgi:SAM-dependent methyltransferase
MNFKYTLGRQHLNKLIEQHVPNISNGINLDLGASFCEPYHKYYSNKVFAINYVGKCSVMADLENKLSFKSESVDLVTAFNVYEHLFSTSNLISESVRILNPGGYIVISTPFMKEVHPHPNDYFRFTQQGWEKILQKYDLNIELMIAIGNGPFEVVHDLLFQFLPKILRPVLWSMCIMSNKFVSLYSPNLKEVYPLGIFAIAKKQSS